jgi:hypothetical protein
MTVPGSIARGLAAGTIGTAVFDAWLFARYRQGGGAGAFADWESSAGLASWEDAPAPALVGKRVVEGVTGHELAPHRARLVSNVMHWAYGIGSTGSSRGACARRASATASCSGPPSGAPAT